MFNSSMFQSIKDALTKNDSSDVKSLYKEIMKFKPGNTYTLRLLPNVKEPGKTFNHYFVHGWKSFSTGQYVSALSLQTFGERDPIAEDRYRMIRLGNPADKEKAESVRRQEYWAVNVLVVDDPVNPENNGKVKILRYGRQLNKIIESAISGEDASEFGVKVFDISKDGCNFKIKAEKQGEYTVYTASRFTSPSNLNLTDSKVEEIYNQIHNLEAIEKVKSVSELNDMWNIHFHNNVGSVAESAPAPMVREKAPQAPAPVVSSAASVTTTAADSDFQIDDETVAELLKGLD